MMTEGMYSSRTGVWETPQDFFDEMDSEFHFTLDACALPENAKCGTYYTPEEDGLAQPWTGTVWCNPPYGREIGKWIKKGSESAEGGGDGRYAAPRADGHAMVPRLHLPQGGDTVRARTAPVQRRGRRAFPVHGLRVPSEEG